MLVHTAHARFAGHRRNNLVHPLCGPAFRSADGECGVHQSNIISSKNRQRKLLQNFHVSVSRAIIRDGGGPNVGLNKMTALFPDTTPANSWLCAPSNTLRNVKRRQAVKFYISIYIPIIHQTNKSRRPAYLTGICFKQLRFGVLRLAENSF